MKSNASEFYIFILIIFLGFFLRIYGSNYGLPYAYNSDELVIIEPAVRFGTGDLNPHRFDWPSGMMYFSFILYGLIFSFGRVSGIFKSINDFKSLYFSDLSLFLFSGRIMVVLFGVASIVVLNAIVRLISDTKCALITSLLFAVSFLHIQESHFLTPDVPMTFFIILSFFYAIKVQNTKMENFSAPFIKWGLRGIFETDKDLYLSAFFAGVATAMKYNAILAFIFPIVVILNIKILCFKKKLVRILFLILFFLAGFLILCPFSIFDYGKFFKDIQWQLFHIGSFGHIGAEVEASFIYYLRNSFPASIGVIGSFIIFFAFIYYVIFGGNSKSLITLYPIIFFVPFLRMEVAFDRYIIPLIPILCFLNAYFLTNISNYLKSEKIKYFTVFLLVSIIVAPQFVKAVKYDIALTKGDTRSYAKLWIEKNIASDSKIGVEWNPPPLNKNKYCIEREYREILNKNPSEGERYKFILNRGTFKKPAYDIYSIGPNIWKQKEDEVLRTKELKLDYIILDSLSYGRFYNKVSRRRHPFIIASRLKLYRYIEKNGELIKTFSSQKEIPNGPIIKVYKLKNSF